tara:strand:- start:1670 stop:2011 length:342 start_codon:yes stop_codon:yes gene_type:complete
MMEVVDLLKKKTKKKRTKTVFIKERSGISPFSIIITTFATVLTESLSKDFLLRVFLIQNHLYYYDALTGEKKTEERERGHLDEYITQLSQRLVVIKKKADIPPPLRNERDDLT